MQCEGYQRTATTLYQIANTLPLLFAELDRLREACLHRDNGYEKCRLCKGWAHMGEPVQHDKECPLKETTTDDQRS